MRYRVVVSMQAQAEIRAIVGSMRGFAPGSTALWRSEIRERIKTLAVHPERCVLAPESNMLGAEVREVLHGKPNRKMYRILFTVEEKLVVVLHVRHGSRLEWDGL